MKKQKIRSLLNLIVALVILPVMAPATTGAQPFDFSLIIKRVQDDIRSGVSVSSTDNYVTSQKPDGSWADVVYGKLSVSVGSGTTGDHLARLFHIASAVSNPAHSRYNNISYKEAVRRGLEFWYGSNTVDPNWYYNNIDFPQRLGGILVFMREFKDFIPVSSPEGIDEQKIISLMQPQAISDLTSRGTGANAIDFARHYIYRGVLTEDSALLVKTRNRIEEILTDNIKGDLVYQDHGPQIQISSYGKVFCNGIIRLATYLSGSPAAFNVKSENFGKVIAFIRETQLSSIRGGYWDFSVMGREVSRSNALNGNLVYLQKLVDFKIDSVNKTVYLDAMERIKGSKPAGFNVREFNKHYWASDYTQHARSEYLFTVRNVSARTVEAESGNGENLKANYFSYGTTCISVDGKEYVNIMPYWDWSMIPGSTFPHTSVFPTRTNWGTNFGKTTFVGGVSDGIHGAAVLDMDEGTTKAKKSWFFFEDEIVCLGAAISDNSGLNVRTTLNQAKMEKPSYISEPGSSSETMKNISSSAFSASNLHYIRNGNIAYFFPVQTNLMYTMKAQTGRWRDINETGSTSTVSGNVFTLWVDHGTNPDNAAYIYVVVPGIDSQEKARNYDLSAIEIPENSASVQAVFHKSLDILQVIFHKAGAVTHSGRTITVDKPCALMLKNGTLVSVADPSQSVSNIPVTINSNGKDVRKTVVLPSATGMKGSSVTMDFELPTGTSSLHDEKNFMITCYPNLTRGPFTVMSSADTYLTCQIRNITGQKIQNTSFYKQTTVDLSGQPSGTYFLSVSDGNIWESHKIVKY